ncbi:MAG: DEAD/DEAH box helicase [Gammaproteobacteria bacterium]|nr:DEAD/DEAH box helicase [Gammaproteobacteria bacterium]
MSNANPEDLSFRDLDLGEDILRALDEVGYETPSPIQAKIIPFVMHGHDVIGQAQTGTGKTAAFALPILSQLNFKQAKPQVLVLAPTRELAIQVAEAFQKYSAHIKQFRVLPIYGGQEYGGQIRQLKRGVHVVVGTPGRVMDHMRKGTLDVSDLKTLVLDEGDEMLRMGFIDDVEWVLEQIPKKRQIALFSATMPPAIRRIANRFLKNPKEVSIQVKTTTASTINQRYWIVSGMHKLDALTRILEVESFDAIIIFVRTKTETVELAEKLNARGYAASALNGDIQQKQRERTIEQLKNRKLDILVATDVAARGLDVERISHVINYDIPYDNESYVHRIGRTGRAGRTGDAILFVAPRELRMLRTIERSINHKIKEMELPSVEQINNKRIHLFKEKITKTLTNEDLDMYVRVVNQYQSDHDVAIDDIAAALAFIAQGGNNFLLKHQKKTDAGKKRHLHKKAGSTHQRSRQYKRGEKSNRDSDHSANSKSGQARTQKKQSGKSQNRKYTYRPKD